jgi:hypothetical protein
MIESKSPWKSVTDREKWAARRASFVAKAKGHQGGVVPAQARGDRQEGCLDGQEGDQEGDKEDDRCHQEDDQRHQEGDQPSTPEEDIKRPGGCTS